MTWWGWGWGDGRGGSKNSVVVVTIKHDYMLWLHHHELVHQWWTQVRVPFGSHAVYWQCCALRLVWWNDGCHSCLVTMQNGVVLHWGVRCWHSPFYGCGATLRCQMLALSLLWLWCYTEVSDAGTLPSMAVVLHWSVRCWHSPFYGCGATLRCQMLALSLLWLWCYTIVGGSCHKYNFCRDKWVCHDTPLLLAISISTGTPQC